jgi:hypothetical protein
MLNGADMETFIGIVVVVGFIASAAYEHYHLKYRSYKHILDKIEDSLRHKDKLHRH